ncbi:MAG: 30S ribosomal protein S19 [Candidatus Aenigmatarchaeota archaeon]
MAKEFKFRGKSLEELKEMDLDEFAELLNSRERRSLERDFTDEQEKVLKNIEKGKDFIKTHARDMIIIPKMVGKKIGIHNGEEFITVEIEPKMLGHYLGEFTQNRRDVKHSAPGIGATKTSKYIPLK